MNSRYFEVNEEGCNIRSKIYYDDLKKINRVILCLHGFGGHKDNKATEKLAERVITKYKGIAVITFNWPCHGDDVRKKLELATCEQYLTLMLKHIKDKYGVEKPFCVANSFGAYMTLKYVHKYGNPFTKIILRCPAIDMYDSLMERIIKKDEMEKLKSGKEALVGFDRKVLVNADFLKELKEEDVRKMDFMDFADDILIIHGTSDEIIPFEEVVKFSDDNVIELVAVEGADHRFRDQTKMERVIKTVCEFFAL